MKRRELLRSGLATLLVGEGREAKPRTKQRKVGTDNYLKMRLAYCKSDAGPGNKIECYLDTDRTGEVITVICTICGGTDLNQALPQLQRSDEIWITYIGSIWKSVAPKFQACVDCDALEY